MHSATGRDHEILRVPIAGVPSKRVPRLIGAALAVVVLLAATSGTAGAHAQLESTSPDSSSVLEEAPTQVLLHFGEPVEIDFGSVRVLGPSGQRVDSGGAHHPSGDSHAVATSVSGHLPRGTYVVAWRVISDDSHPVHGAFIFSIGTAGGAKKAGSLATALGDQSGSTAVGVAYWLIRFVAFIGLLVLVGLVAMVLVSWPPGGRTRRMGRILWASWSLLVVSTVVGIAIQGVYAAALPLADIVRPSLVDAVLHTRFGEVELLRLILLVAVIPVLMAIRGRVGEGHLRRPWVVTGAAILGAGLLATAGLAGHASAGDRPLLGFVLDVVHLGAGALWLGGLVLLATVLIADRREEVQPAEARRVTLRVSAFMFAAVAVVVATGTIQSIRQVGSFFALFHTDYGRTLLVKIALVVALVAAGAHSRRTLHGHLGLGRARHTAAAEEPAGDGVPGDVQRNRLRRSVLVELGIALCVLAVTAVLVNAVPAKQAAALPFSHSFTTLGVQVNTIVDPAEVGAGNEVHVYILSSQGVPKAIPELDASISLPAQHLGPLGIPLRVVGPGHFTASNVAFPVAGNWILKLTVRTGAIDEQVVTTTLPVH
jgi:copper transport protein